MNNQSYCYYVYRITCTYPNITPKYYYGYRKTSGLPQQDIKYWSSSATVQAALLHYGEEWFQKKIIAIYSTKKEALEKEIKLHHYFNVKKNSLFYNKANQTSLAFEFAGPASENHRHKLREKATGRKHSDASKQKMSLARKGKKRKPLSQEHRDKISQALRGRTGSGHNEKTRQKQAASRRAYLEKAGLQVHSKETKEKISKTMLNTADKRRKNGEVHVCPWCGKQGQAPGIFVWHFKKCSLFKNLEV